MNVNTNGRWHELVKMLLKFFQELFIVCLGSFKGWTAILWCFFWYFTWDVCSETNKLGDMKQRLKHTEWDNKWSQGLAGEGTLFCTFCVSTFICSALLSNTDANKIKHKKRSLGFCLHPLCLHLLNLETLTNINANCANLGSPGETISELHVPCLINDAPLLTVTILNPESAQCWENVIFQGSWWQPQPASKFNTL